MNLHRGSVSGNSTVKISNILFSHELRILIFDKLDNGQNHLSLAVLEGKMERMTRSSSYIKFSLLVS